MPNWRLTLVLTAVFVALGLYAYFVEMKQPEVPPADDKSVTLWTLSEGQKQDFRRLRLQEGDRVAVLDRSEQGDWFLAEPTRQRLDSTRVDYTVNNLRDLKADRLVEEKDARPTDYGLEPPAFRVTLQDKDMKPMYELLGGAASPTRSGYYVQKKGEPAVYLVATWRLDDVRKLVTAPPTPTPSPPPTPKPTPSPRPTPSPVNKPSRNPTASPAQPSARPGPASPAH